MTVTVGIGIAVATAMLMTVIIAVVIMVTVLPRIAALLRTAPLPEGIAGEAETAAAVEETEDLKTNNKGKSQ